MTRLTTTSQGPSDPKGVFAAPPQVGQGDHAIDPARVRPVNGFVIAFVGSDGSGKSTVTREIASWLARDLAVTRLYFGTGDGPVSLPRRALRRAGVLVLKWRRRAAASPADTQQSPPTLDNEATANPHWIRTLWRTAWAVLVAYEKRRRLATMNRARRRGRIVVCDRFPQADILGYNDGPLLGHWLESANPLLRTLAKRELAFYRSFARFPPDLVIKLHVAPAVAARRKKIASLDLLERKADGIKRLRYPGAAAVLNVDADRPLESVVDEIKSAICRRI